MAHQGQFFKEVITRSGDSYSDIADKLGVAKRTFEYWFTQEKIKPYNVFKIKERLGIDLQKLHPQVFGPDSSLLSKADPSANRVIELERQLQDLKEKHMALLEEHTELLKKNNK